MQIIPKDSQIPEYREEQMIRAERMARIDKVGLKRKWKLKELKIYFIVILKISVHLLKFELHKPYIQMAIYKEQQGHGRSLLAHRLEYTPEEMAKHRTMALYDEEVAKW